MTASLGAVNRLDWCKVMIHHKLATGQFLADRG